MKNRITIGISSIVLIFLVLCLSVFSLLSLSDAKAAMTYAKKYADSVQIYYEADSIGQTFIRDYRAKYQESQDASSSLSLLAGTLPAGSWNSFDGDNTITCEIPTESGQTLHLEMDVSGQTILSYYIYNSSEYVIDTQLPVWTGN